MPPDSPPAARFRYRRLPGRMPLYRRLFYGLSGLWLGDDHLLQVNSVYFNESYRRFAYGDIQALLLRETSRGVVYSFALATLAAGFGLSGFGMGSAEARGVFFGIGGFWLILLMINLIRGNTCPCSLQTAAGPHPLPSLNRLRPAHKALRLLTERIETAQAAPGPGGPASGDPP